MTKSERKLLFDFINIWIQTHPDEMEEFYQERLIELAGIKDPFLGESKDKTMRKIGSMPIDLHMKLKNNFEGLFDKKNKNLYMIFEEFPVFKYVDKI